MEKVETFHSRAGGVTILRFKFWLLPDRVAVRLSAQLTIVS